MRENPYYSLRTGIIKKTNLSLDKFRKLLESIFNEFSLKDYFYEYFGYHCEDSGFNAGILGNEAAINARLFIKTGIDNLWPINNSPFTRTENELFDIIEFLYDCISKPFMDIAMVIAVSIIINHLIKTLRD